MEAEEVKVCDSCGDTGRGKPTLQEPDGVDCEKCKIQIDEKTLRGLYLILCGLSYDHSGSEVCDKAVPIMNDAHKEIIRLGKENGFDNRGGDL